MGEGLGEVAERRAGAGIDLLAVQADIVGDAEKLLEIVAGALDLADPRQRLDEPEAADSKGALGGIEVVGAPLVAIDERASAEAALDTVQGGPEPRVVGRLVVQARHEQQRRVKLVSVELADIASGAAIEAARIDRVLDLGALGGHAPPVDPEADLAIELDQPVQRDPAHKLRKGILPLFAAHFPQPVVRLSPAAADDVAEAGEQPSLVGLERAAAPYIFRGGGDDSAIDVELALPIGAVSDPDRP